MSVNCTFLIYASLTPLPTTTLQNAQSLQEFEDSLSSPTGASTPIPIPAHPMLQSLMISPNCGLVLEMEEAPILLAPVFWSKGRMYGWIAGVITGIQCWLLVWQMDSRQSPSVSEAFVINTTLRVSQLNSRPHPFFSLLESLPHVLSLSRHSDRHGRLDVFESFDTLSRD